MGYCSAVSSDEELYFPGMGARIKNRAHCKCFLRSCHAWMARLWPSLGAPQVLVEFVQRSRTWFAWSLESAKPDGRVGRK
eukprot:4157645-Amphidinium_carterae.2